MYLIQLFLPLYDNDGVRLSASLHAGTRDELVARFGGLTAYSRAPADGVWQEDERHTVRDELVIYEVMSDGLDTGWWRHYREVLEQRFRQQQIVIRAQEIRML
ncbi:hypothetical protein [Noviherbaspirillum aridicola]|uniref:Uncharacterized protein n=1 Tax=Noviherbaspirillum aridicola TaxID=2849687 RepID=A0ABQ4Q1F9_9BURK|nr:hypothetical protein [Noviherbaspirillum aridicola]GIZ50599.1 hypothetical protein NCCP691_06130 [Noviherbaspirillum aridicola]